MKSVALSEAKDKLSALVEEVQSEHEIVRITRHGQPAAVLISEEDLESLQETLFWLSQPGIRGDLAADRRRAATTSDLATNVYSDPDAEAKVGGGTVSATDIRARFGLPAQ